MAIDLSGLNDAQRGIAQTLDRPLFVEAGAGSGKTFTLTRRIAWALTSGSGKGSAPLIDSLDQALVITFTNAAALEIKERVRSTLRENGMAEQALTVDDAWISTIHGMCSRILRRNALDLGLDPQFKMLPTTMAEDFRANAQELVALSHAGDAELDRAVGVVGSLFPPKASAFGRSSHSVMELAWGVVAVAGRSSRGFESLEWPKADPVAPRMAGLLANYEGFLDEKRGACKSEKAIAEAEALVAPLREFCTLAPSAQTEAAACDALSAMGRGPKANSAPKDRAKELQVEIAEMATEAKLGALAEVAPTILALARELQATYDALKRNGSYLDNDDLIRLALCALRDRPDVGARYAEKFRLVMVDEFQDTDPRQVELVSLLSGGGARLCTVGDAQQSIYRFRGADVRVFSERGQKVDPSCHKRLDVNYRSHADILSFVDAVFGGYGGRPGLLRGFMSLSPNAGRKDGYKASGLPRIAVEVVSGANAAMRTKGSVAAVADRLAAYAAAGEDPDDMALLLGRTTNASAYVDALRERGIKCVVTGGSTFSQLTEVKVVAALVRTLANPHDTQAGLFPVLSSDLFRLDADDFCLLGTGWQEAFDMPGKRKIDVGLLGFELPAGTEASPRLARAHEVLSRAFSRLSTWDLADVVQAVLVESGWLLRLESAGAEGRSVAANLLAAVRYLRDLTRELGLGVARASQEFDLWLEVAKAHPAVLSGGKGDAVRVMTIHASKGLEFPIVAVAECWGDASAPTGVLSEELPDGTMLCGLAISVAPEAEDLAGTADQMAHGMDLLDFVRLAQDEGLAADEAEKVRLLYVGVTRAREALVLSVPVAEKRTSRLAQGVVDVLLGGALPEPGAHALEFGGSAPAALRVVALSAVDGEKNLALADSGGTLEGLDGTVDLRGNGAGTDGGFELFCEDVEEPEVGFWTSREGTYSYSSAAAALEEERRAAEREHADHASPDVRTATPSLLAPDMPRATHVLDEDEPDCAPQTTDGDRATSLGSAFHEAAQAMVLLGGEVDKERVDAIATAWGLSPRQRARLDAALGRWGSSALRREVLAWPLVRAEVPFYVSAPSRFGDWLEGAIDLLCTGGEKNEALVVDYKTGDAGLAVGAVRARHAMQAELYASVLLGQGFSGVECAFVCVERADDDDPAEPLVVRYRFGA